MKGEGVYEFLADLISNARLHFPFLIPVFQYFDYFAYMYI